MILSVGCELHWTPDQIEKLYLDEADLHGLEFWFHDLKRRADEIEAKFKTTTT